MAIDINSVRYTAVTLIKKSSTFASPRIDGLKLTNTKFYEQYPDPRTLKIETHRIESPAGIHIEFSSRKNLQNGNMFEVYKFPEETIKILKNRFGEILKFKSSLDCHNLNPEWTYKNAKESMAEKFKRFLK